MISDHGEITTSYGIPLIIMKETEIESQEEDVFWMVTPQISELAGKECGLEKLSESAIRIEF